MSLRVTIGTRTHSTVELDCSLQRGSGVDGAEVIEAREDWAGEGGNDGRTAI